jgi:TRAP-type C4-dicarboxylate transport system substrate-binding protein
MPFVSDDLVGTLQVINQLHRDVPALQDAWEDQNVVFLGASGVETYHLLTNFPVNSLADLEGRKILAPGPSANWIKSLGAVPVNGALPTYYNQVQTGVADGMVVIISGAFPNKHYEVAPYVTLVGIGAQMTGGFGVNKDIWDGLSDDVKQVLTELGEEYTVAHAEEIMARYDSFIAKLPEVGATVTEMSDADIATWKASLPNLAGEWAEANADKGAQEVMTAYMAALRDAGIEPKIAWDER